MYVYVLHIFFIFLFVSQTLSECPDGWWGAGDVCYTSSQQRLTWHEAQQVSTGIKSNTRRKYFRLCLSYTKKPRNPER